MKFSLVGPKQASPKSKSEKKVHARLWQKVRIFLLYKRSLKLKAIAQPSPRGGSMLHERQGRKNINGS